MWKKETNWHCYSLYTGWLRLQEIEDKAPQLKKQREDYEAALQTLEQLTPQLDAAMLVTCLLLLVSVRTVLRTRVHVFCFFNTDCISVLPTPSVALLWMKDLWCSRCFGEPVVQKEETSRLQCYTYRLKKNVLFAHWVIAYNRFCCMHTKYAGRKIIAAFSEP